MDITDAVARTLAAKTGRARITVLVTCPGAPYGQDEPYHIEDYSLDIAFDRRAGIVSVSAESPLFKNSLEAILCPPAGLAYSRQSVVMSSQPFVSPFDLSETDEPGEPGETWTEELWQAKQLGRELTREQIADLASAGPIAGYLDPMILARFAYEAGHGFQRIDLGRMPSPYLPSDPGRLARTIADPRIQVTETARGLDLAGQASSFLGSAAHSDGETVRLSFALDPSAGFVEYVTLERELRRTLPTIDERLVRPPTPARVVTLRVHFYGLGRPVVLGLPAPAECEPRPEPSRGVILDVLPPSMNRKATVAFEGEEAELNLSWESSHWLTEQPNAEPMVPVEAGQELVVIGLPEARDDSDRGEFELAGIDRVETRDGHVVWQQAEHFPGYGPGLPDVDAQAPQRVVVPILRIDWNLEDIVLFYRVAIIGRPKPLMDSIGTGVAEAIGLAPGQHVTVYWIWIVDDQGRDVYPDWILRDDGVSLVGGPANPYSPEQARLMRDLDLVDFLV